ncbi:MAG: SGNH/GDSL hydrolase family protein [Chthoniobacterales bacterium]
MIRILLVLFLAFLGNAPALTPAVAQLPMNVKRVVFLGDSITYAGQYTAFVEAYYVTRHPGQRIEFINVGLPSETVSGLSEPGHAGGAFPRPDLHERLARVLAATQPDLVFVCYGMNDGINLPFDEKRFDAFKKGIHDVHNAVLAVHAQVIHLTPPYYDARKKNNPAYADTLDRYSQWLLDQRAQQWKVADIHGPMTAFIEEKRKTEPTFAYATDGVHPNDLGHWIMAKQILLFLGAKDLEKAEDVSQMLADNPNGLPILALVRQREDMLKDAWLTSTKHLRPGMQTGLPMEEALKKSAEIQMQLDALLKKPVPAT